MDPASCSRQTTVAAVEEEAVAVVEVAHSPRADDRVAAIRHSHTPRSTPAEPSCTLSVLAAEAVVEEVVAAVPSRRLQPVDDRAAPSCR